MRWNGRAADVFPRQTLAQAVNDIRAHSDVIIRVAAAHFWLQERNIEIYDLVMSRSKSVADKIEAALGDRTE